MRLRGCYERGFQDEFILLNNSLISFPNSLIALEASLKTACFSVAVKDADNSMTLAVA